MAAELYLGQVEIQNCNKNKHKCKKKIIVQKLYQYDKKKKYFLKTDSQ